MAGRKPKELEVKPALSVSPDVKEIESDAEEMISGLSGGDYGKDMNWLYHNLMRSNLTRKDAPSDGAWGIYLRCQESNFFADSMMTKITGIIFPTKKDMDRDSARYTDDGRSQIALIDGIMAAVKASRGC